MNPAPSHLGRRELVVAAGGLLCLGFAPLPTTRPTPSIQRSSTMADKRAHTYELYLAAWSAVSDDERKRLLRESLTDNIVFTNQQQTRHGLSDVAEHLKGFQAKMPGASFRMNNMIGWKNHALAEWQMVDAKGEPGFSGYDVLTLDDRDMIEGILMFTNVEGQKIACRRRDQVSLGLTP